MNCQKVTILGNIFDFKSMKGHSMYLALRLITRAVNFAELVRKRYKSKHCLGFQHNNLTQMLDPERVKGL